MSEREPELLKVPMSDGTKLAVHRYAAGKSSAPAILCMTPYRKEGTISHGWRYAERGYDLFVADVRGFGGSVGKYEGLFSEREIQDGVELIQWIASQKFNTGKVGMVGGSYCGAGQMLIASRRPKGLVCISPMVGPVDTFRDWTYRGGIFSFAIWGMTCMRSGQIGTVRDGLKHYYTEIMPIPFDNEGHHRRSPEYVLDRIEVPALTAGGWYDYFLRGTTRSFMKIKSPKRLVVGPWGHISYHMTQDDDLYRWFDYWLLDKGSDPTRGNNVRLFRTGTEEWIERDKWFDFKTAHYEDWRPLTRPAQTRILANLANITPAPNVRPQHVLESGYGHWGEVFQTDGEEFKRTLDIDGPIGFEAHIDAGECRDFELHARLSVVQKDGKAIQLTEGRLRATHRANDLSRSYCNANEFPVLPWHPHDKPEPLVPGEPTRMVIEMQPVCHRVQPGERLRLGLSFVRADESDVPVECSVLPSTRALLPTVPV